MRPKGAKAATEAQTNEAMQHPGLETHCPAGALIERLTYALARLTYAVAHMTYAVTRLTYAAERLPLHSPIY